MAIPFTRMRGAALAAAVLGSAACLAVSRVAGAAEIGDMPAHVDASYANPQPPYPDGAQVNGEQGNVVLNVQVSQGGHVRNVRINESSGFPDLDNAAIEGVLGWHFVAAVQGGETVSSWTRVKIVFQLPTAIIIPPKSS
jgi:protein TonB